MNGSMNPPTVTFRNGLTGGPGERIHYARMSIVGSETQQSRLGASWVAESSRRPRVRRFELILPESVDDCVRALAQRGPEAKLLAGGTDLLPQLKNGLLKPARVIDLSGVARLRAIEPADGQGLRIRSAVTARTLELDKIVRSRYLSVAERGALVGSVQVRNLATLGGNLCNAAPSADMVPTLLALEAEAGVTRPTGEQRQATAAYFT